MDSLIRRDKGFESESIIEKQERIGAHRGLTQKCSDMCAWSVRMVDPTYVASHCEHTYLYTTLDYNDGQNTVS